jgi:hypothetical protein
VLTCGDIVTPPIPSGGNSLTVAGAATSPKPNACAPEYFELRWFWIPLTAAFPNALPNSSAAKFPAVHSADRKSVQMAYSLA